MILYPNLYLDNVKEISIETLRSHDIEGLILDVDNTLIDYEQNLLEGAQAWCEKLKANKIKICILSNTNNMEKVRRVAEALDIPFIGFAKKPLKYGFKKAQKLLGIESKRVAVAGDQILTDVLRRQ